MKQHIKRKMSAEVNAMLTQIYRHAENTDADSISAIDLEITRQMEIIRQNYIDDGSIAILADQHPYVEDYSYGHFLHLLKLIYDQAANADERELIRLKYYPLAFNPPVVFGDLIDEMAMRVSLNPTWIAILLWIISFGQIAQPQIYQKEQMG